MKLAEHRALTGSLMRVECDVHSRQDLRVPKASGRRIASATLHLELHKCKEIAGIWSNNEVALAGDPPGELEVVDGNPEGGKIA